VRKGGREGGKEGGKEGETGRLTRRVELRAKFGMCVWEAEFMNDIAA